MGIGLHESTLGGHSKTTVCTHRRLQCTFQDNVPGPEAHPVHSAGCTVRSKTAVAYQISTPQNSPTMRTNPYGAGPGEGVVKRPEEMVCRLVDTLPCAGVRVQIHTGLAGDVFHFGIVQAKRLYGKGHN